MSFQLLTLAVAAGCGIVGAAVYAFAYLFGRAQFRLFQLAALCCNVIALVQIAIVAAIPGPGLNLLYAAVFLGLATLATAAGALVRRSVEKSQ